MDLLRLACARLGFGDRVAVVTADVVDLARLDEYRGTFDVVTARAFGEPMWTLACAKPFLTERGVVIVSEPPAGDVAERWPAPALAALGLAPSSTLFAQVKRFERR
jgi:16S rRNA G527 N7-methylase RsmG